MACSHINFEKHRVGIGFQRTKSRDVLSGFPVHHLAVVQSRFDEYSGIRFALEVRIRAVALHVEIIFGDLRIAPLFVFANGERQRRVEHGIEHIDERNVADDGMKKIGAQISNRTHQQAAGAAAFDDQLLAAGEMQSD